MKCLFIIDGDVKKNHPFTIFIKYRREFLNSNEKYKEAKYTGTEFSTEDGYYDEYDKKKICEELIEIFSYGPYDKKIVKEQIGDELPVCWE